VSRTRGPVGKDRHSQRQACPILGPILGKIIGGITRGRGNCIAAAILKIFLPHAPTPFQILNGKRTKRVQVKNLCRKSKAELKQIEPLGRIARLQ
jgi:hypothetical protein